MPANATVHPPTPDCLGWNMGNGSAVREAVSYYRITFDAALVTAAVLVNAVLIAAIVAYRSHHTGTMRAYNSSASMKLVVNLAASDLVTGAGVVVRSVAHHSCGFNQLLCCNRFLCPMKFVPSFLGQISSGLSLIAIAVDRYVAVFHSFHYRTIMTDRTCNITIIGLWTLAIVVTHTLYVWNLWRPHVECVVEKVAPLWFILVVDNFFHIVVIALIGGIHYKLHRKACESSSQQMAIFARSERSNIKSAKLIALVIGVYSICWFPLSLLHLMGAASQMKESIYFYYAIRIVQPMRNVYIVINPFIYAWKNLEVRDSIKWFFKKNR